MAIDKINRFRANPGNELAAMFTESFTGTYTNTDVTAALENTDWVAGFWADTFGGNLASWSMNSFKTRPGTVYSQFQNLSAASSPLNWSNNLGWAAHQYATWVELDGGSSSNPHSVAGAPGLGDRFTNAGVTWTSVGENIAPDWPLDVNLMHMGFAIDWGTGIDGIQEPPGHRNAMLNDGFTDIGIGIVDAGWTAGDFTQVQHLATVSSAKSIVYGFVYDAVGDRLSGVEVGVYDESNTIIGTAFTDAIGAYTLILDAGENAPHCSLFRWHLLQRSSHSGLG